MYPPQATDKTSWMNEQVTFLICCNKQYRCCLERGQQDQVNPSVNKKGNMPSDAQLETVKCCNRAKIQSLLGSCCGHFSAIRQLQLSQVWGSVPILLACWKEVPKPHIKAKRYYRVLLKAERRVRGDLSGTFPQLGWMGFTEHRKWSQRPGP